MKKVSYIYPISHRFREPFHSELRRLLANQGIDYNVVYCAPFGANVSKKDTVDLEYGARVPMLRFGPLVLQFALKQALASDLVIIQQENRLLLNYIIQILGILRLKKVAFFGHGRNLQAVDSNSAPEKWKRFWLGKVDWWFAYTAETARYVTSKGFPASKITAFNNSIDTRQFRADLDAVSDADCQALRVDLRISSENVGIFVGGLYHEKRLAFLLESCVRLRETLPDFVLLVVGGGPQAFLIEDAAKKHDWIKYVGPKFGKEKATLFKISKVYVMPGLVGLGILDAFCAKTPLVTTNISYHSPEISYLSDDVNGIMVDDANNSDAYAYALHRVLTDETYRQELVRGGTISLTEYTIENMAARFCEGVLSALGK